MKPSKHKMTVLSQIFKLIPRNLIPKLANEFGIDRQSRVFSPTSHVLALVFGQLTHALGLNDICDTLRNHCGLVSKIRDCVPPSRNGLSHANRNRDAGMAEKLFWEVLAHLNAISPNFRIQGRRYCALPRRFKRMIHVVDSTTIQLIANCLDWAKHRRRKAAAKMHLRLDLRSFLPNFILVKTAGLTIRRKHRRFAWESTKVKLSSLTRRMSTSNTSGGFPNAAFLDHPRQGQYEV